MTIEELQIHMDARLDAMNQRFSDMQRHLDGRFGDIIQLLMKLESDLRMFYRELGYQDSRLDAHDARLDNLEGKQ